MGTWIEFRCEKRGGRTGYLETERCWSDTNSGPMEMAEDTRASVIETLRLLEKQARSSGWKKTKEGWICPHCAELPSNA